MVSIFYRFEPLQIERSGDSDTICRRHRTTTTRFKDQWSLNNHLRPPSGGFSPTWRSSPAWDRPEIKAHPDLMFIGYSSGKRLKRWESRALRRYESQPVRLAGRYGA